MVPPSLVVRTSLAMPDHPTATQSTDELQETASSSSVLGGTARVTQVVPESVVAMMAGVNALLPDPTAVQALVEAHETPERLLIPAGMDWVDQVTPPSVVAKTRPLLVKVEPVAKQSIASGQLTPLRPGARFPPI
jgi:hypothetical protein